VLWVELRFKVELAPVCRVSAALFAEIDTPGRDWPVCLSFSSGTGNLGRLRPAERQPRRDVAWDELLFGFRLGLACDDEVVMSCFLSGAVRGGYAV